MDEINDGTAKKASTAITEDDDVSTQWRWMKEANGRAGCLTWFNMCKSVCVCVQAKEKAWSGGHFFLMMRLQGIVFLSLKFLKLRI